MSTIGKRVIYVGPADGQDSKPLNVEGVAVQAIAPGSVLKQTTSGLDLNDAAATVFGEPLIIADKDQMRTKSVDDSWTINENMVGIRARSGELFNALVVTGQDLDPGTPLTRDGTGNLRIAATTGAEEIVAYSDEDVTTTGTQLVRVYAA